MGGCDTVKVESLVYLGMLAQDYWNADIGSLKVQFQDIPSSNRVLVRKDKYETENIQLLKFRSPGGFELVMGYSFIFNTLVVGFPKGEKDDNKG